MAVFNYELNRRWCESSEGKSLAGCPNDKYTNSINGNQRLPFISSNGYYGYLPVFSEDSTAMETNDISQCGERDRSGTRQKFDAPWSENAVQCFTLKFPATQRKRNSSEEMDECFKRIRKDSPIVGTAGYQVSLLQPTYNTDYHYPRCTMDPVSKCRTESEAPTEQSLEENVDLLESLLKHIHGCDMYNFYSTSDL